MTHKIEITKQDGESVTYRINGHERKLDVLVAGKSIVQQIREAESLDSIAPVQAFGSPGEVVEQDEEDLEVRKPKNTPDSFIGKKPKTPRKTKRAKRK